MEPITPNILILDNGAYSIKANLSPYNFPLDVVAQASTSSSVQGRKKPGRKPKKKTTTIKGGEDVDQDGPETNDVKDPYDPVVVPNCIVRSKGDKRTYVGDEIERCKDFGGVLYRRPFERGMLTAWECEKMVWDRLFTKLKVRPEETSLLVTESYHNIPTIAETYDQMVFEEWEFKSYYRANPASLIPHGALFSQPDVPAPECAILVDIGYSYTHVTPIRDGKIVRGLTRRIDIGGKLLTNHLKAIVSFRQLDMQEETHVMNQVREDCCFVSLDWKVDLEVCRRNPNANSIVQEYVLPDFSPGNTKGYIRTGPKARQRPSSIDRDLDPGPTGIEGQAEQVLSMNNERFSVPEVLFNPSDIGMKQAGIAETVAQVIECFPEELQGMFWANVGLVGGLAGTLNVGERLERELRMACPTEFEVGLYEAEDPVTPTFFAAQALTLQPGYLSTYPVTREEYMEYGSEICRRRFGALQEYDYAVNSDTSGPANVGTDEDAQSLAEAGLVKLRRAQKAAMISKPSGKSGGKSKKGKVKGSKRRRYQRADSDDAMSDEDDDGMKRARRDESGSEGG